MLQNKQKESQKIGRVSKNNIQKDFKKHTNSKKISLKKLYFKNTAKKSKNKIRNKSVKDPKKSIKS